jgi:RNA polymerase-binding transcription factor DksA
MTSHTKDRPPHSAQPDMILLALFQSRLRERSVYLGEEIRAQRSRLSAHAQRTRLDDPPKSEEGGATLARIQRAEQALAAVRQAQERIGRGRYGLCDVCQEPIGWDELLAAPEQTVCRSCSRFGDLEELPSRS